MFKLVSKYKPSGDQPKAIEKLVEGVKKGKKHQVLLGATGTGKTFVILANGFECKYPALTAMSNISRVRMRSRLTVELLPA